MQLPYGISIPNNPKDELTSKREALGKSMRIDKARVTFGYDIRNIQLDQTFTRRLTGNHFHLR